MWLVNDGAGKLASPSTVAGFYCTRVRLGWVHRHDHLKRSYSVSAFFLFLPWMTADDSLITPKSVASATTLPVRILTTPQRRWQNFHLISVEETGGCQRTSAFLVAPQKLLEPTFELLQSWLLVSLTVSTAFYLNVVVEDKPCSNRAPTPPHPKTSPRFFLRVLLRPCHLVMPWRM